VKYVRLRFNAKWIDRYTNTCSKLLFQIPESSSLISIEDVEYLRIVGNILRDIVKTENFTRDLLLQTGLSEKAVDAAFEVFKDSRDAYEVWKTRFKTVYRRLNATDRIGLGHDASIFLHTAKTAGTCIVGGKIYVI